MLNCSLWTNQKGLKAIKPKNQDTNTMYQKVQYRWFFWKKGFFLENLRNQGENLEKFKKQPFKAKKPE